MYSENRNSPHSRWIGAERMIYSEDFLDIIRDNVSDFLEQAELIDDSEPHSLTATPRT